MYRDVTMQSARDAEGMDEIESNELLCKIKKVVPLECSYAEAAILYFPMLKEGASRVAKTAIQLDKCVAERPSRGVGIAALPLECSVRFDSCCPYLLPLFPCIRPATMARGIPRKPTFLFDINFLTNTNVLHN
jgi:hypothetical protein